MKTLIAGVLLAFAGLASAGTTVLYGETCTNSKICYDIPNDKDVSIDLYAVTIHPFVYLYLNGDQYKGTLPGSYPYPASFANLLMQSPTGGVLYLTATYSSHVTCTRYCQVHWTLVSGSIVQ